MKTRKNRMLSLLLVLALALTLTAPALAGEVNAPEPEEPLTVSEAEPPEERAVPEDASEEAAQEEEADESLPEEVSEDAVQEDEADASVPDSVSEEPSEESLVEAGEPDSAARSDASAQALAPSEEQPSEEPTLDQSSLTLAVLESKPLKLLNATPVSFLSSDENVITVSEEGLVTARQAGSAIVQVIDDQGRGYCCSVTVVNAIIETKWKMKVGQRVGLNLEGREIASVVSSDKKVVRVNRNLQAVAKQSGVAELTITDTLGDIHVCVIQVQAVLSAKTLTLSETKTAKLSFQGSPITNAVSSNEDVATVDEKGTVTGVKEGKAVLSLTDASGKTSKCKVTVKVNYLARTAASAKKVYGKIVSLRCRHSGGTRSYKQLLKRKKITCGTGVSVALQEAGLLKKGDVITHTAAGSVKRKLKGVSKALKNKGRLKKGTYTIVKAGCRFSKLPKKYQAAGMVYVQDSNICISAGNGYIYTTNESSRQYRRGHYFKTKMNRGYTHTHTILYVIVPNS